MKVEQVLKWMRKQHQKGYQVVGVVFGRTGQGKSTFAYQLFKRFAGSEGLPFLYSFSLDEVETWLLEKEKTAVVFDEVAFYLSSYRGHKEAERFRQMLQLLRVKQNHLLLVSPFGIELSKLVRRYANFVCLMKKRGVAKFYLLGKDYLRGKIWAFYRGLLKQEFCLSENELKEMERKKQEFLAWVKEQREKDKRSESVPLLF